MRPSATDTARAAMRCLKDLGICILVYSYVGVCAGLGRAPLIPYGSVCTTLAAKLGTRAVLKYISTCMCIYIFALVLFLQPNLKFIIEFSILATLVLALKSRSCDTLSY
jgi:hypothetical protein